MNRWLSGAIGIWLVATIPSEENAQPCLLFSDRIQPNTQGNVIIVGRTKQNPHIVVVPATSSTTLDAVRQCVPAAFLTNSRRGNYIHAGAFADYNRAASVSAMLRSRGLDARVVYFP
ncbi:hypothetical protein AB3R30_12120 [Leptolyngbyaceae cyanobacterium UHCC 1019]